MIGPRLRQRWTIGATLQCPCLLGRSHSTGTESSTGSAAPCWPATLAGWRYLQWPDGQGTGPVAATLLDMLTGIGGGMGARHSWWKIPPSCVPSLRSRGTDWSGCDGPGNRTAFPNIRGGNRRRCPWLRTMVYCHCDRWWQLPHNATAAIIESPSSFNNKALFRRRPSTPAPLANPAKL